MSRGSDIAVLTLAVGDLDGDSMFSGGEANSFATGWGRQYVSAKIEEGDSEHTLTFRRSVLKTKKVNRWSVDKGIGLTFEVCIIMD